MDLYCISDSLSILGYVKEIHGILEDSIEALTAVELTCILRERYILKSSEGHTLSILLYDVHWCLFIFSLKTKHVVYCFPTSIHDQLSPNADWFSIRKRRRGAYAVLNFQLKAASIAHFEHMAEDHRWFSLLRPRLCACQLKQWNWVVDSFRK